MRFINGHDQVPNKSAMWALIFRRKYALKLANHKRVTFMCHFLQGLY